MSETSGGCVYDGVPLEGVQIAISDSGFIKVSTSGNVAKVDFVLFDGTIGDTYTRSA